MAPTRRADVSCGREDLCTPVASFPKSGSSAHSYSCPHDLSVLLQGTLHGPAFKYIQKHQQNAAAQAVNGVGY